MTQTTPPSERGWFWQAFHERDGWASTTKSQRNIAFALATVVIVFYVFSKTPIPTGLPELLAMYFGIAVGGRIADRWVETKEKKDA